LARIDNPAHGEAPAEKLTAIVKQLPGNVDQTVINVEREASPVRVREFRFD
jgi:hypothetical protein